MKYAKANVDYDRMVAAFREYLDTWRASEGGICFQAPLDTPNHAEYPPAILEYKPEAYYKMQALVNSNSLEVGWHGVTSHPAPGYWIVEDIIVPPQTVTGVTVTTDQDEYEEWLLDQPDEVFNNIRLQGHSHVNMGTVPSGVDRNYYASIVQQLTDTDYYIFFIANKKGEHYVEIYDMEQNIVYEKHNVTVVTPLDDFVADANKLIKTKSQHFKTATWDKPAWRDYLGYEPLEEVYIQDKKEPKKGSKKK